MGERGLTPDMKRFLSSLAEHHGAVSTVRLSEPASHEQDGARQRCRKLGYASRPMLPHGRRGWAITEAGRAILHEASNA